MLLKIATVPSERGRRKGSECPQRLQEWRAQEKHHPLQGLLIADRTEARARAGDPRDALCSQSLSCLLCAHG